jgi:hypothetical protein
MGKVCKERKQDEDMKGLEKAERNYFVHHL